MEQAIQKVLLKAEALRNRADSTESPTLRAFLLAKAAGLQEAATQLSMALLREAIKSNRL